MEHRARGSGTPHSRGCLAAGREDVTGELDNRTGDEIRAAVAASWRHQPGQFACWCGGDHSIIGAHLHDLAEETAERLRLAGITWDDPALARIAEHNRAAAEMAARKAGN